MVVVVVVGVVVVIVVIVSTLTLALLQYHLVKMASFLSGLDVKDALAGLTALGRDVRNG